MRQTCLVFSYRGSRYALDIRVVREIVWLPQLSAIEELPAYVAGVFNLRGHVVPVMDLGLRFGHAHVAWSAADRVIVIESGADRVGIVVNEVHDVLPIAQAEIEAPERYHGAGGHARFVRGEAKTEDGLVMLLDADALLHDAPSGTALDIPAPAGADDAVSTWIEIRCPEDADVLRRRALELAKTHSDGDEDAFEAYAVIRLDGELFGLGLGSVREFCHLRRVTPVPCCPPHVLGNIALRGDIVTLFDIRPALGIASAAPLDEVVVARLGDQVLGVPAAEILDVIRLAPAQFAAVPVASRHAGKAYCQGVASLGNRAVDILDLEKLVAAGELQVMEEVQ